MQQVLFALEKYTDEKNDIPAPADIIKLLTKEPPRITEAEFIEAQKWQERNGFPMFSDALDVIRGYKEQQRSKRQEHRIECKEIQALVSQSIKKITG